METVLFSRISIGIFGLSEFSQRLPSVLGAALYFYTVFRICGFLVLKLLLKDELSQSSLAKAGG
jgi:4-amino-4-deoxy-L-arabinose transferase-like glycosyltransferase